MNFSEKIMAVFLKSLKLSQNPKKNIFSFHNASSIAGNVQTKSLTLKKCKAVSDKDFGSVCDTETIYEVA